jgi:transporter family protein
MAILFALITNLAYGLDFYFVRRGLMESPEPMAAAFITLTVNICFFVLLSILFEPLSQLTWSLVYLFIIAGILAPGAGRLLSYRGLETLGMSISVPIVNAESIFSVTLAIIFLNEPITLVVGAGVLGIIAGLVLLGLESGRGKETTVGKRIRYRYLLYPLMASVFYGLSVFVRKLGLNVLGSPILGAAFTSGTSWLILTVSLVAGGHVNQLSKVTRQSFIYFLLGGGATCVAWYSLFNALHIGKVSIVTPIATSYSLVTLFFSYVLLRKVERINRRIVAATVLVVGGIILLSLAK